MHTARERKLVALYNVDGKAERRVGQVIDQVGLRNGAVADLGNDGDADIFGANWLRNPPVRECRRHDARTRRPIHFKLS
jgi:hypothetical protein